MEATQSVSKLRLSHLRSTTAEGPNTILLWALELTLIILRSLAVRRVSHRQQVRQKCPRWFVPNCIQNLSTVSILSGILETPALLIRQFISLWFCLTWEENWSMEALLPKSRGMNSTLGLLALLLIYSTAAKDFFTSLPAMMTQHPFQARPTAVSFPMPVLPPVMMASFPRRSLVTLHDIPALYFLAKRIPAPTKAMAPNFPYYILMNNYQSQIS